MQVVTLIDITTYSVKEYERLMSQIPLLTLRGTALVDYIDKMIQQGFVYVLDDGSVLKGLIGFYANDTGTRSAYLSSLVVDESQQGKGLGMLLFNKALEKCRERGMLSITANVVRTNCQAISFYGRLGFKIVGPGRDDYHHLIRMVIKD